jgi:hypothetical protein
MLGWVGAALVVAAGRGGAVGPHNSGEMHPAHVHHRRRTNGHDPSEPSRDGAGYEKPGSITTRDTR